MFTVWLCTRISDIRGLIKNDYATEISYGLYHLVGDNGTCTGNGNNLCFFFFLKLQLAAVLVSGLTVLCDNLSDVYIFLYAGVIEMLGEFHCCERKL